MIDRAHIVYPEVEKNIVPRINNIVHTFVIIFAVAELTMQPRKPSENKLSNIASNGFLITYYLFFLLAGVLNERYYYPIMNYLDLFQHVGMAMLLKIWWNIVHYIGYKLNKIFYEDDSAIKKIF